MGAAVAEPLLLTMVAVFGVSLLSLVGALSLATNVLRRHGVMLALVALAAGTLMGDSILHLLPEAVELHGSFGTSVSALVLVGFVLLFVLEVVLRWGHSHAEHMDDPHHGHEHVEPFGWLNLVGDLVHNLLDGVIIATSFIVSPALGIATTIAVAIHEIPQELGDFAVLVRSGMRPRRALMWNLASALTAVLGALFVFVAPWSTHSIELVGVPLIAGAFLYIAAADLIPELHHHSRGREALLIMAAFVVGLGIMWGLLGLEGVLPGGGGHADH